MALNVPGRQTVTVLAQVRQVDPADPTRWARDPRGNAVYTTKRTRVRGCSFQPSSSTENTSQQREELAYTAVIYAPSTWPGGPVDSVEISGAKWEIIGYPQRWEHPRLGHVVVNVRKAGG